MRKRDDNVRMGAEFLDVLYSASHKSHHGERRRKKSNEGIKLWLVTSVD